MADPINMTTKGITPPATTTTPPVPQKKTGNNGRYDSRWINVGTEDHPDLQENPNYNKTTPADTATPPPTSTWNPSTGDLYSPEWQAVELDRRGADIKGRVAAGYASSNAGGVRFGNEDAQYADALAKLRNEIGAEATAGIASKRSNMDTYSQDATKTSNQNTYNLGTEYGFSPDSPYFDAANPKRKATAQWTRDEYGNPISYDTGKGDVLTTTSGDSSTGGMTVPGRAKNRITPGVGSSTRAYSPSAYGF